VIDFELQRQLAPYMRDLHPLPGVFDPDFIAANQGARADHLVKGSKQVCARVAAARLPAGRVMLVHPHVLHRPLGAACLACAVFIALVPHRVVLWRACLQRQPWGAGRGRAA
jgi:hypothetical protein